MVTNCKQRHSGICSSGMLCFLEYLQNYTHNKSSNFLLEQRKDRVFFPANLHSLYGVNVN